MGSLGTPATLEGLRNRLGLPSKKKSPFGTNKKPKKPGLSFKSIEDAARKAAADAAAGSIGDKNVSTLGRTAVSKARLVQAANKESRAKEKQRVIAVREQSKKTLEQRTRPVRSTTTTTTTKPASGGQQKGIRLPETTNPGVRQNFTVEVASPVASAPQFDTREIRKQLQRTIKARVKAAQSGQDVTQFRDAEDELRQVLAAANFARNRSRAAAISPEQALANAQALDEQVIPAQAQAVQGALANLQRQQEFARRFPGAFPQSRVSEAERGLTDASLNLGTTSPTFFADRAASRPDQAALNARAVAAQAALQDALAAPRTNATAVKDRGFLTVDDANRRDLATAQIEAQKRLAEQVAGGQPGDALLLQAAGLQPGTPISDEQRALLTDFMNKQFQSQADISDARRSTETAAAGINLATQNPDSRSLVQSMMNSIQSLMDNPNDALAAKDILAGFDRIDLLPNDIIRQGTLDAIKLAAQKAGLDVSSFRPEKSGLGERIGAHPNIHSAILAGIPGVGIPGFGIPASLGIQVADPNSILNRGIDTIVGRDSLPDRRDATNKARAELTRRFF